MPAMLGQVGTLMSGPCVYDVVNKMTKQKRPQMPQKDKNFLYILYEFLIK